MMRHLSPIWLLRLFVLAALANLAAALAAWPALNYASKPLLLALLALYFWSGSGALALGLRRWLLAALLFSWLGDVLLMWPALFLPGLGAFLLAHLAYVRAFVAWPGAGQGRWRRAPWEALPFLLLLLVFNGYLSPWLRGPLSLAVPLYSLAIVAMCLAAWNLRPLLRRGAWLLAGALLFLLSDSLIALSRFTPDVALPSPAFFIMLTYIAGQWAIVWAVLGGGGRAKAPA